jgi:hypothetical protein
VADVINLGQRVSSVDVSPQFQPYSKVIIHVDEDSAIEVGNDTGRTLEFDNPFGTRAMAQNILNKLRGFQYQPYQADGAFLDPSAEIGDAIGTATSYGGLYTRSRKFGRLMKADISAPHDEEINHEFKYESPQERQFTRVTGEIKASIILTNNMIQSEVLARKDADNVMASRITQTSESITAEVERATSAEGSLSSRITQTAESVTSEIERATTEEGKLSTRISQTDSSITAEVNSRKAAVQSLSSRITLTENGIAAEVNRATKEEGNLKASLSVQATEIAAKVSASGGSNASGSFSWSLTPSGHRWYANGSSTPVMSITASGITVNGTVNATSGTIGGFTIGANALQYNGLNYGDTDKTNGAYIGISGIQLGKNFQVDTAGNVYAQNMTLKGTLTIGEAQIKADTLRLGALESYQNYGSWNGTTSTVNSNGSYWSGGAACGYNFNNASNSGSGGPAYFNAGVIKANYYFLLNGLSASWKTKSFYDRDGNFVTIQYLGH